MKLQKVEAMYYSQMENSALSGFSHANAMKANSSMLQSTRQDVHYTLVLTVLYDCGALAVCPYVLGPSTCPFVRLACMYGLPCLAWLPCQDEIIVSGSGDDRLLFSHAKPWHHRLV